MTDQWMIYGASGYSGTLLAEEAVRRGHRPVLAGRSQEKLAPLAERLGLEMRTAGLDDPQGLGKILAGLQAVLHAAGPFRFTAEPMQQACLALGVSYLDITGEIAVFEATFSKDAAARQKRIALISGVGFDVVPTDCLSAYVAGQVPGANTLEIAFAALIQASGGTLSSTLESLPEGGWARRDGKLVPYPLGKGARRLRFADKSRPVLPVPWGDLATAYRTTGIPNITTYMANRRAFTPGLRLAASLAQVFLSQPWLRRFIIHQVSGRSGGPDADTRKRGRSHIWARAARDSGQEAQAWLETLEGYSFNALSGVSSLEKVLEHHPVGALTPAQAFGADFVLEIEASLRLDKLPE